MFDIQQIKYHNQHALFSHSRLLEIKQMFFLYKSVLVGSGGSISHKQKNDLMKVVWHNAIKNVFNERLSFMKSCFSSKVVFHEKLFLIKGVFFRCKLSFVMFIECALASSRMIPYHHFPLSKPLCKLIVAARNAKREKVQKSHFSPSIHYRQILDKNV